MRFIFIGFVFIGYIVHVLIIGQKDCSFSVHGENEKYQPILLRNYTGLIVPKNGKVNLKRHEIITLLCPDLKNYLVTSHSNVSSAQCVHGQILRVANHDINFSELKCKKIIRGSVSVTTRHCGNNLGVIYIIGYPLSRRRFITLIEVCYEVNSGNAFYTEHSLHGQDIRSASKSTYRPSFSTVACSVGASVAYKQTFQKSTFSSLLKSSKLAIKYINKNSFLARGHLSPDADFIYASTQFTSYYYINTTPQWQAINGGNWLRIENLVRKVASIRNETLTIITGTHDILTLPDINNNDIKIYLNYGNKLPVPKFIWKIVYSKNTRSIAILVNLNNPFTRSTQDFFCNDICDKIGWNSTAWSDYEKGLIRCCSYDEFSAVVQTAPNLTVNGHLYGLQEY